MIQQRTPVTVTAVPPSTAVIMTAVHRSNKTSTPVTMTGALEPPLTPIGTIKRFCNVSEEQTSSRHSTSYGELDDARPSYADRQDIHENRSRFAA